MNSQKGFVIPIIIAIVAIFALGGGYYYAQKNIFFKNNGKENVIDDNKIASSTDLIGGDKDIHGCIGSAGYSWCELKNKCLRVWEEKCEVISTATTTDETKDWKTYRNEEYGFEFKYPTDFSLKDEGETVPEVTTHHQWWINFRSFNGRSFIGLFINENTILDINKKGASPFILGTKNGIKYNAGFEDISATAFEISLGAHVFRIKFTSFQDSFASLEPDTFYNNEIVINQILSTFKFTDNLLDKTQPSVSSIFPSSGSIGTSIELKGYNLLSNRGDQNLMIENSSGEKASLGFGNPTHLNTSENYVSIKFVVPEKVCKKVATDAALPCDSWMTIVPGEYKIYVAGPSYETFTSNKVKFVVIDQTKDWKTYRNEELEFEIKYPSNYKITKKDNDTLIVEKEEPVEMNMGLVSFLSISVIKKGVDYINYNLDLEKYLKTRFGEYYISNNIININDIEWFEAIINNSYYNIIIKNNPFYTFYNNKIYEIGGYEYDKFYSILRTFKFTK